MKYALAAKFSLPLQFPQSGWTVWGMSAAQRTLLVAMAEDERSRDDARRKKSPRKRTGKPAPPKTLKELEQISHGRKPASPAR